jgi:hypothetical protein
MYVDNTTKEWQEETEVDVHNSVKLYDLLYAVNSSSYNKIRMYRKERNFHFYRVTSVKSFLSLNHNEVTKLKYKILTESSITAWVDKLNCVGYQVYCKTSI